MTQQIWFCVENPAFVLLAKFFHGNRLERSVIFSPEVDILRLSDHRRSWPHEFYFMWEINLLSKICKFLLARGWIFFLKVKLHRMAKFGFLAIFLLFNRAIINSPSKHRLIVSPIFCQTRNLFIFYCLLQLFIGDYVYCIKQG